MEMRLPSLLSDLKRRMQRLTSSGKSMCHQKLSLIEYPPAPSRQLLPNNDAVGGQGMTWAIGVFHKIPKLGRSLSHKKKDLLAHQFVDDVLELGVMDQFCCFIEAKEMCRTCSLLN